MEDHRLTAALDRFKRLVETKAADPVWHPSGEGVRESLAAALRDELDLQPDGVHLSKLWPKKNPGCRSPGRVRPSRHDDRRRPFAGRGRRRHVRVGR